MLARLALSMAVAGLAAAPVLKAQETGGGELMIALCGSGVTIPIPFDRKPRPAEGSPACHVACLREHPLGEEPDLDG